MEDLDMNLLRVFEALLCERSVTRAAHSLGMTQSATSHALNRLRQFFDDPLFVKAGHAMEPTPKAESLQPAVFDIMATVRQRIHTQSVFQPDTASREFVLCIYDLGELVFLPTLLQRLRREAPHCSLRTMQAPAEQIEELLRDSTANLAIGSYRTAPDGLYKQRLFMHSFITIAQAVFHVGVHRQRLVRSVATRYLRCINARAGGLCSQLQAACLRLGENPSVIFQLCKRRVFGDYRVP